MEALILFGVVLILMGAAFGVPAGAVRNDAIRDQDAPVLGAAVLGLGLGGLNLAAAVWYAITGEITASAVGFAALAVVGAVLGGRVVLRKLDSGPRAAHLLGAAVITIAGFPGYFAPLVAALATAVIALAYLAGLIRNPRTLLRSLDPRD